MRFHEEKKIGFPWGVLITISLITLNSQGLVFSEEIPLGSRVPSSIQEIELVYSSNKDIPGIYFKSHAPKTHELSSYRPPDQIFKLMPFLERKKLISGCDSPRHTENTVETTRVLIKSKAPVRCRHVFSLQEEGRPLDALSFDILHLKGEASGQATVALVDEATRKREGIISLATIEGKFDVQVPLSKAGKNLDPRRLAALVIETEKAETEIRMTRCELIQAQRSSKAGQGLGFWVWEYQEAILDPASLIYTCRRYGCKRLLIQVPSTSDSQEMWDGYADLFRLTQRVGIETFALDGYPEAVRDFGGLVEKIERLSALLPEGELPGFQLDVEPYLLQDFFLDESMIVSYLEMIDSVKKVLRAGTRLSIVMPFWFSSHTLKNRPIAFSVIDRADEVAIMSYRTDMEELLIIAEDSLRYGNLADVPVWLSIETTALPVEQHIVLRIENKWEFADAYLDRQKNRLVLEPPSATTPRQGLELFRVYHRTTVRPDRLTFAGRSRNYVRSVVSTLAHHNKNPHFAGILIHDLKGFLSLPE